MKLLCLDVSSHTGWALFSIENNARFLNEYGLIETVKPNTADYPRSMLEWSYNAFQGIKALIDECNPDYICIEETVKGSKNHLSQKLLEWCHFRIADLIVNRNIPVKYFQTGEWRHIVEAKMTKEEREHNKIIRDFHKKGIKIAKDSKGKRIGKVGKKHVNVRIANALFGLNLKLADNNQADAILMGEAFFRISNKEEVSDEVRARLDL
jgi:Holliday junction resolvasome RuvABC endonuclease subunit